jgi:hypothetical protein
MVLEFMSQKQVSFIVPNYISSYPNTVFNTENKCRTILKTNKQSKINIDQIQGSFRIVTFIESVDEHAIVAAFGVDVSGVEGLSVVVERFHLRRNKKSIPKLAAEEVAVVLDWSLVAVVDGDATLSAGFAQRDGERFRFVLKANFNQSDNQS